MNRATIARIAFTAPAVALAVGAMPLCARADDGAGAPTYALSWVYGAEAHDCIRPQELARAVERRLGRAAIASMADATFVIDGRIERVDGDLAATIVLRAADGDVLGERRVTSRESDCHTLDRPLSLVVALIIDPDAARESSSIVDAPPARETEDDASSQTHAKNASSSVDDASAVQAPSSAPRKEGAQAARAEPMPSNVGSEVAAGVAVGKLPTMAPGVETAARIAISGNWTARLGVALWMPERAEISGHAEGAWLTLVALNVEGCRTERLSSILALRACAGAEPGMLVGQGSGLDVEQRRIRPAVDAVVDGWMAIRAGPSIWMTFGAKLDVPFVRDEFVAVLADGARAPVFRSPPFGGSAWVGTIFDVAP
jgi:hypothetical protein